MNILLKHSIRFVLIAFLQALVLNQLEIGFGIPLCKIKFRFSLLMFSGLFWHQLHYMLLFH